MTLAVKVALNPNTTNQPNLIPRYPRKNVTYSIAMVNSKCAVRIFFFSYQDFVYGFVTFKCFEMWSGKIMKIRQRALLRMVGDHEHSLHGVSLKF